MKKLIALAIALIVSGTAFYACAGEPPGAGKQFVKPEPSINLKPEPTQSLFNSVSVSPYYTVAFENFNGKTRGGAGVDVALGLSKSIAVVSFLESSDTDAGAFIDRFGAGIQMTGKLGKWLKPYGRFSVGYAMDGSSGLDSSEIFLRPEFGATIDIYHYNKASVSVLGAWALDVDTEGHAAQRLKTGLSFSF